MMVAVIGYEGLVTGTCLAERGNEVNVRFNSPLDCQSAISNFAEILYSAPDLRAAIAGIKFSLSSKIQKTFANFG